MRAELFFLLCVIDLIASGFVRPEEKIGQKAKPKKTAAQQMAHSELQYGSATDFLFHDV